MDAQAQADALPGQLEIYLSKFQFDDKMSLIVVLLGVVDAGKSMVYGNLLVLTANVDYRKMQT